jgi:hypothetical protein
MTERQLLLFHREAIAIDSRRSAETIADVNAGMAGGEPAKTRMNALLRT